MPHHEMIERVAKAIYMTEFPTLVTLESWDEYMHKNDYYECAKAAISSMKQPTLDMITVPIELFTITSTPVTANSNRENVWRSMIESILK